MKYIGSKSRSSKYIAPIDEIVKPFYAGELEVCKIWEW